MSNDFHKNLTLDDIHASVARTYADITARDADSVFNTDSANINKIVRVDSPISYYALTAIAPTFLEFTSINGVSSVFAQLSSNVAQIPSTTNPTVITYNVQDEINGIGHSTSVNPGELEVLSGFDGAYNILVQPQVGKDSGGMSLTFDMFMQKDTGSGFVDVVNSNIKLTVKDSDITDVIVLGITVLLNTGDKVRFMQRASSTTGGLGLKAMAAETGPPTIPATPSVIFTMHRTGSLS